MRKIKIPEVHWSDRFEEVQKWATVVFVCGIILTILWIISPSFQPEKDPFGFQRSLLYKLAACLVAIIGTSGSASAINWVIRYDWWGQLAEGNMATGIATAGLFIGIGLAISGAV
jgi:hypothetical protein